jgi:cryptochrome
MPTKCIYGLRKEPVQDQREAGVRIVGDGKDDETGVYPKPMFDCAKRKAIGLEGMKKAYSVGLYDGDPRVIDGTWWKLFPDSAKGPMEGRSFPMLWWEMVLGRRMGMGIGRERHGGGWTLVIERLERCRRRELRQWSDGEGKGGDIAKGSKRKGARGVLDKYVVKRTKK